MSTSQRVLFDGEAFTRHTRSGITRYFAELIREYRADAGLGVDALTPYRWVANTHLARRDRTRYIQVPLPGRHRATVLERMNRRSVAAQRSADLVHHSLYEAEALERWQATRRVVTIYDFTNERLPGIFEWHTKAVAEKNLFIRECDALLCISETTKADLLEFHPGLNKPVVVTPLGVASDFFNPSPARIRGLPDRYLLHVGNRHGHKNADQLFRAFAELSHDDPTLRLVLCGASVPEETGVLSDLGIAERTVRMRVSDRALPWLYRKALAFVFPSRYEGFGLPVVEAMAAGCATVASDIPVMHEVGDDAISYANPDDVGELVDQLRRLIGDESLRSSHSKAGRLRATDFTWRRTAETTAGAYSQL